MKAFATADYSGSENNDGIRSQSVAHSSFPATASATDIHDTVVSDRANQATPLHIALATPSNASMESQLDPSGDVINAENTIRSHSVDQASHLVAPHPSGDDQESCAMNDSNGFPPSILSGSTSDDPPRNQLESAETSKRKTRQRRMQCFYPNGLWTVLVAQFVLLFSNFLYTSGFWGCQLVVIEDDLETIFLNITTNATTPKDAMRPRGIGLWSWEDVNGTCLFTADEWKGDKSEFYLLKQGFEDVTGSSWIIMRSTTIASFVVGCVLFVWLMVFSCVAYSLFVRNILGLLLIVALSTIQSQTWNVLQTEFCEDYDCIPGSSLISQAASSTFAVLSGILLILSNNDRRRELQRLRDISISDADRHRDGLNDAEEVPVESGLIELSLIDPMAATERAQNELRGS